MNFIFGWKFRCLEWYRANFGILGFNWLLNVGSGSGCSWRRWRKWGWGCRCRPRGDWASVTNNVLEFHNHEEITSSRWPVRENAKGILLTTRRLLRLQECCKASIDYNSQKVFWLINAKKRLGYNGFYVCSICDAFCL